MILLFAPHSKHLTGMRYKGGWALFGEWSSERLGIQAEQYVELEFQSLTPSVVTLDKLLNLSMPQFSYLKNRDNLVSGSHDVQMR